jgi:hypothetical protein
MESETELGNELGAVKYVSEITGSDVKDVANWFILLIIFVFDPLAIILVIATNQAFNNLKPKTNIYGEPKIKESTPEPTPSTPEEIKAVENEIQRIQKSGAIGRRIEAAVAPLKEKLNNLRKKDDNTINYM